MCTNTNESLKDFKSKEEFAMINAVKSTTVMKMEGSYDDIMGILRKVGYSMTSRENWFKLVGKFKHMTATIGLRKETAQKVKDLSETFNIKIVE